MAVNNYGQWIPEEDYSIYPEEKWCDMDYVAAWIKEEGYDVKGNFERFIRYLILNYEEAAYRINDNGTQSTYYMIEDPRYFPDSLMIYMPDFIAYVYDNGGLEKMEQDHIERIETWNKVISERKVA